MMWKSAAWAAFGLLLFNSTPCFCQPASGSGQQIANHFQKAKDFLKENRPDLAAQEYEAVLALDPNNTDAQGNLGVLLFFKGDYLGATPHLRAAVKSQPTLWKIQALLGMSEKRTGQPAEAQADLERAFPQLQEEKLRREAGLELVELYSNVGELDKAANMVGTLRRLLPADTEILYTARRIYGDLADDAMLRLAMLAPDSARMHQLMAHEMMRQGNRAGAIEQYQQALKLDPRATGLHFELGEVYSTADSADPEKKKELEEAKNQYLAEVALNPFDAKSECRLGDIAFRGSELKEAFRRFSRCLELQPNDADANAGVGKTLMAMHEPQKAQQYLERALRLDSLNAATHYRLAMVYRESGRKADADRELAEFRRLKETKNRLGDVYKPMHVVPPKPEEADPDVPMLIQRR